MPELPEVENVGRSLRHHLLGQSLTGLEVHYAGILGQPAPRMKKALVGKPLTEVHRHGKYLILTFGSDAEAAHLMIHLRMTGQILLVDGYIPDKHVHLTFDFDGVPVHYRDIRKFGRLELVNDGRNPEQIAHVGPDMLTVRFAPWHDRVAGRKAPIKALLLDQGIAAGLGNIYVDESLFLAGVHPLARPVDLDKPTLQEVLRRAKQVLRLSVKHGGTTFLNFTDFHGQPGNFRRKLRVYGRAGQKCGKCDSTIESLRVAGRSSCYCPQCQPI